jgi:hypothetical protein
MTLRIPSCRALDTATLWTSKNVIVDPVLLAEGGAGALLGLCGLRIVPMALLALAAKVGEYLFKACAPLTLAPTQATLRPALADLAVVMGAWILGRLVRWIARRRKQRPAFVEPGLSVDLEPAGRPARQALAPDERAASGERSWTSPGAIVLELEDRETQALCGAIDSRLEDLRRVADRPAPHGVRDDIWQTIATLEAVLARLPAAHLYDRRTVSSGSRSGRQL